MFQTCKADYEEKYDGYKNNFIMECLLHASQNKKKKKKKKKMVPSSDNDDQFSSSG